MSLLQDVDDLVALHRQRMRQIDEQLADSLRQHSALLTERDRHATLKTAELAQANAHLEQVQKQVQALEAHPFPEDKPLADFADWRDWARHHLLGIDLQQLDLSGHQCLLLSFDVSTAIHGDQPHDASIVLTLDPSGAATPILASTLGTIVVVPGMQGVAVTPHGLRCAPTHLVVALCTLCADAPSTMENVVGAKNVCALIHEFKEAERALAALVGIAL